MPVQGSEYGIKTNRKPAVHLRFRRVIVLLTNAPLPLAVLLPTSREIVDNLNNIRRDVSIHCRNKKKEYLKAKIEVHETNSRKNNTRNLYRSISDFKKSYHPRTNIVKVEKGDLFTESHSILARWRKHFFQLLDIYGVNDVRHTEIHTVELLVPEPRVFEFGLATENQTIHKSPDIDQIRTELINAGSSIISDEIHALIISIWK